MTERKVLRLLAAAVLCLMLRTSQASAAGGWTPQSPPFPLVNLLSADCPDASDCYAVGSGELDPTQVIWQYAVFTHDGGRSWQFVHVGAKQARPGLLDLSCPLARTCLVLDQTSLNAASAILVRRTDDGGKTWRALGALANVETVTMVCPSASVCYIAATRSGEGTSAPRFSLRSIDGGRHWTRLTVPKTPLLGYAPIVCTGVTACMIPGMVRTSISGGPALRPAVLITKDGGKSWTLRNLPVSASRHGPWIMSFACASESRCVAGMDDGTIFQTKDGWATSTASYPSDPVLKRRLPVISLSCAADGRCVAVTSAGLVLHGPSWQPQDPNVSDVRGIVCAPHGLCLLTGSSTTISITYDLGASWQSPLGATTNTLHAISCVSLTTCAAVGDIGAIETTSDGGHTWVLRNSGTYAPLNGVACPSPSTCIAVGGTRQVELAPEPVMQATIARSYAPVIIGTRNGGENWSVLAHGSIGGKAIELSSIACPTVADCYAAADTGGVLVTANGGEAWHWTATKNPYELDSISCPSAVICFAAGGVNASCPDHCTTPEKGIVLMTRDGGASWQRIFYRSVQIDAATTMGVRLYSIACPTTSLCYAAGERVLIQTINAGHSWTVRRGLTMAPGGLQDLTVLACRSPSTCFVAAPGPPAAFGATTDDGKTWKLAASPPSEIRALTCPGPTICYSAGLAGRIFRWTS